MSSLIEQAAMRLEQLRRAGVTVLDDGTQALLVDQTVLHLDVGLAQAAARVGMNSGRPLLLGNVRGQLKALMDQRRPIYNQLATVTVDTNELTAAEVVDQVIERLQLVGPSK